MRWHIAGEIRAPWGLAILAVFSGTSLTPQVGGDQFISLMQLEPRNSPFLCIVLSRRVRPDLERSSDDSARSRLGRRRACPLHGPYRPLRKVVQRHTSRGLTPRIAHGRSMVRQPGADEESESRRRTSRVAMAGTHIFVCTHIRGHCHRWRGWLVIWQR